MTDLENLLVACVRWNDRPPGRAYADEAGMPDLDREALAPLRDWIEENRPDALEDFRQALEFVPLADRQHMRDSALQRFAGDATFQWILVPGSARGERNVAGFRVFAHGDLSDRFSAEVFFRSMDAGDADKPLGEWGAEFMGYARWQVIAYLLGYSPGRLLAAVGRDARK